MSEIELKKHVSFVKDRQAWLASTFRDLMTTGQSFDASNTYREKFYDDVIKLANQNTPMSSGSLFGERITIFSGSWKAIIEWKRQERCSVVS